jgi:hypothetical protein
MTSFLLQLRILLSGAEVFPSPEALPTVLLAVGAELLHILAFHDKNSVTGIAGSSSNREFVCILKDYFTS